MNPFNYQNPVNPAEFAGRDRELQLVLESVELSLHGRQSNVQVRGDWGIGKTSLLHKIRPKLEEFGLFMSFDLGDGESQIVELVRGMIYGMLAKEPPGIALENLEVRDAIDRHSLATSLQKLKKAFGERYKVIVVAVDNFERASSQTANFLKDVFQSLYRDDCRYMLIVSGRDLSLDSPAAHDPLVRFYRQCPLGNLTPEETTLAIRRPLKLGSALAFTDDAVDHLHRTTLGHPFFLKLMCFHVCDLAGGKGTISRSWIESHWEDLSDRLADAKFGEEFGPLSRGEQDALLRASLADEEFEPRDLRGSVEKSLDTFLNRLTKSGLLRKLRRGEYVIYHPLFREFLRAQAAARGMRPKKHAHVPKGQPLTGRVELQERVRDCCTRRLDILDPHFRGQAVSLLEHAHPGAQIRILRDQVVRDQHEAQWSETLEWVAKLPQQVQRRLQIRAWGTSSANPFPEHYRVIIGDRRIWEVSHSLDQIGRKGTTITDKTEARQTLEREFDRYWRQAEQVFPVSRRGGHGGGSPHTGREG